MGFHSYFEMVYVAIYPGQARVRLDTRRARRHTIEHSSRAPAARETVPVCVRESGPFMRQSPVPV
eukprot:1916672-Pleurochrysis_carterae.AAC.1